MTIKLNNFYLSLFLSLLYARIVIELPVLHAIDSASYIYYASSSLIEFKNRFEQGFVYLLFNEPVWLIFNAFIGYIFDYNSKYVMFFISFSISFFASFYAFRLNTKFKYLFIVLILLISPMYISNYIVNLRAGIAMVIFIMAFFAKNNILRYILLLLTPFIHISFIIMIFLYIISAYLGNITLRIKNKIIVIVVFIIFFSFLLNNFRFETLRQLAEEQSLFISGVGFIFWFFYFSILILFLDIKKIYNINERFYLLAIAILIFYLVNYFFFYGSARILQVGLLFPILSLNYLNKYGRFLGINLFFLFIIYDWSNRLNIANLGF